MPCPRIGASLLAQQRDGLRDHVIGGEDEIGERPATVAAEHLKDAGVVDIVRVDEREEETRIEEDHSCGSL